MTSAHDNSTLSRCMFVKGAALAGLGAAVAGNSGALFGSVPAASAEEMAKASEEKIVWNHCAINCPGRCALKLHIKDDELVRVETYATDTDDMDDVQPRACLRGRAYRAWVNHPDRIYYPMKRVEGTKRGDGKYEQGLVPLGRPLRLMEYEPSRRPVLVPGRPMLPVRMGSMQMASRRCHGRAVMP